MTEEDLGWNRFIEDVCCRDITSLSEIQKKAVLCFWYDAEMNSGGYSGFADCYSDIDTRELAEAILTVGYKEIADNYIRNFFDPSVRRQTFKFSFFVADDSRPVAVIDKFDHPAHGALFRLERILDFRGIRRFSGFHVYNF